MSADTDPASPLPITVFSRVGERSVAKMLAVVAALNVETRLRYKVRDIMGDGTLSTFCNVFAADYTRAMCAEIPHWVDAEGRPSLKAAGGHELSANATQGWLEDHGLQYGWQRADAFEAMRYGNMGKPACFTWVNATGRSGHIAAVINATEGVMMLAQAGALNSSRIPFSRVMGKTPVKFWVHE